MENVEAWRVAQTQTNDLGNTPAAQAQMDALCEQADAYVLSQATGAQLDSIGQLFDVPRNPVSEPASGPDSPATQAVITDLTGMLNHDAHEQIMDTFVPQVTQGITTSQLQAVMETKEPFTVRMSDGNLGVLDPSATNAAMANTEHPVSSFENNLAEIAKGNLGVLQHTTDEYLREVMFNSKIANEFSQKVDVQPPVKENPFPIWLAFIPVALVIIVLLILLSVHPAH